MVGLRHGGGGCDVVVLVVYGCNVVDGGWGVGVGGCNLVVTGGGWIVM